MAATQGNTGRYNPVIDHSTTGPTHTMPWLETNPHTWDNNSQCEADEEVERSSVIRVYIDLKAGQVRAKKEPHPLSELLKLLNP